MKPTYTGVSRSQSRVSRFGLNPVPLSEFCKKRNGHQESIKVPRRCTDLDHYSELIQILKDGFKDNNLDKVNRFLSQESKGFAQWLSINTEDQKDCAKRLIRLFRFTKGSKDIQKKMISILLEADMKRLLLEQIKRLTTQKEHKDELRKMIKESG